MIQDSINQLLGTAAIAAKLTEGKVSEMKDVKMTKLQQQKSDIMKKLDPNDPTTMGDAKGNIQAAEDIQKKIDKLGNSRWFPNAAMKKTAVIERANTERGINEYKEGFSADVRKAFGIQTPSEIEAERLQLAERERTQALLNGVNNRQAPKSMRQALREQSEEKLIGGNS